MTRVCPLVSEAPNLGGMDTASPDLIVGRGVDATLRPPLALASGLRPLLERARFVHIWILLAPARAP